ncbi:MAG: alkylphosphonate utilization protein [Nitratireductor sp.]|nr:alkylphosphonate utilization protein [Nitratireductor sp.]
MDVKDANGATLNEGDSVAVIKDLKVKGSSSVVKRGTLFKGIHLTDDPDLIEVRNKQIKGLMLRTEFVKKS